jgi:ferredoxin-NADP reductase
VRSTNSFQFLFQKTLEIPRESKLKMICQENKVVCFVLSLQPLTSDIKLITLTVEKGKICFQAGQFIGVYDGSNVTDEEKSFPGTFSIASRPSELPIIRFAIGADNNPRNMRHRMYYHAKPGDCFLLDSIGSGTVAITPNMVMTPVGGPGGIMLIGGGSAVMGLVSIVEELLHDDEGRKIPSIKLFHSNRSNKDIPFYDRLQELKRLHHILQDR